MSQVVTETTEIENIGKITKPRNYTKIIVKLADGTEKEALFTENAIKYAIKRAEKASIENEA